MVYINNFIQYVYVLPLNMIMSIQFYLKFLFTPHLGYMLLELASQDEYDKVRCFFKSFKKMCCFTRLANALALLLLFMIAI